MHSYPNEVVMVAMITNNLCAASLFYVFIISFSNRSKGQSIWPCVSRLGPACSSVPYVTAMPNLLLHSTTQWKTENFQGDEGLAESLPKPSEAFRRCLTLQELSFGKAFHVPHSTLKLRPKKQGLLPSASQKRWLHEAPALP